MPEGDNLARIASVLGRVLVGRPVISARGRPGGARLERVVGQHVAAVEARGKHLLISFSGALTLHTHLGMHGSWHRYRPREAWRRAPRRAVAVVVVETTVCVCFDAPTVELLYSRALAGLRAPWRRRQSLGEALLDQRAIAGLGNVYRNELCYIERLSPFAPLDDVPDEALLALLERAARLVTTSRRTGRRVTTTPGTAGALYVYGRAGRPCRRRGSRICSAMTGTPARRVYWCAACQP